MKTCPCNIQILFSAVKTENFIHFFLLFGTDVKIEIIQLRKFDRFPAFAQNIDCG